MYSLLRMSHSYAGGVAGTVLYLVNREVSTVCRNFAKGERPARVTLRAVGLTAIMGAWRNGRRGRLKIFRLWP